MHTSTNKIFKTSLKTIRSVVHHAKNVFQKGLQYAGRQVVPVGPRVKPAEESSYTGVISRILFRSLAASFCDRRPLGRHPHDHHGDYYKQTNYCRPHSERCLGKKNKNNCQDK